MKVRVRVDRGGREGQREGEEGGGEDESESKGRQGREKKGSWFHLLSILLSCK